MTTTFPTISRRNEDGAWGGFEVAFRDWDFSPEDAADSETLTAWLRDLVADNGEGEWSAEYEGVESDVVTTGPTTDDIVTIAGDIVGPENVEYTADECGYLTLVSATFADGTVMVIGPERDGGYTWTTYSAQDYDHQPMAERILDTDGDTTIASLADAIRKQAQ